MRLTALLTLLGLLLASGAIAEPAAISMPLFRYVDERGVVHFTNVPADRRFARVARLQEAAWGPQGQPVSKARRSQEHHGGEPGEAETLVDEVVAELQRKGVVDDRAFAGGLCRRLRRRGSSARRIRARS